MAILRELQGSVTEVGDTVHATAIAWYLTHSHSVMAEWQKEICCCGKSMTFWQVFARRHMRDSQWVEVVWPDETKIEAF